MQIDWGGLDQWLDVIDIHVEHNCDAIGVVSNFILWDVIIDSRLHHMLRMTNIHYLRSQFQVQIPSICRMSSSSVMSPLDDVRCWNVILWKFPLIEHQMQNSVLFSYPLSRLFHMRFLLLLPSFLVRFTSSHIHTYTRLNAGQFLSANWIIFLSYSRSPTHSNSICYSLRCRLIAFNYESFCWPLTQLWQRKRKYEILNSIWINFIGSQRNPSHGISNDFLRLVSSVVLPPNKKL